MLDPDATYDWLRRLDPSADAHGASIRHLLDLADFADDLAARGRLLPTALRTDPPTAVWRPVLSGPDAAWARVLAAAAPPSLIAGTDGQDADRAGADGSDPLVIWADALDALLDAAARARLAQSGRPLTIGRDAAATSRAWIAALAGSERAFPAAASDLDTLLADLESWQADAVSGPVRACFRLLEPPPASDPATGPGPDASTWQLSFGLQATDEQSLVVAAEDVWRSATALPGLGRPLDAPQETFLAELGKAARLYPEIDRSLRAARPLGLTLDTPGAHHFLSQAAPMLATAGFGVQLPGWWSRPTYRVGLRVKASTPGQPGAVGTDGGVGFAAITDFRYDLALGDTALTDDELAELAELKSPLVRVRGQWVELDQRQLRAGLRLAGQTGELTVGELLRLALGHRRRRRGGRPDHYRRGRRLARRSAVRTSPRPAGAGRDTYRVRRRAPAVSGPRAVLAGLPRAAGPRRRARRRHGPGQDRPAARPAGA